MTPGKVLSCIARSSLAQSPFLLGNDYRAGRPEEVGGVLPTHGQWIDETLHPSKFYFHWRVLIRVVCPWVIDDQAGER